MTPSQLEQAAREPYNAVNDTFFSQSELLTLMYRASMDLAIETHCVERVFTTTTVSGTQEYDFPSQTIGIKYLTYNSIPIEPVSFDEGNSLILRVTGSTTTGTPKGYTVWNNTIIFWPTPGEAVTLKLWTYQEPQTISITSTLEVPTFTHPRMINFMLGEMYAKDKQFSMAKYFKEIWDSDKTYVKRWMKQMKRSHRYGHTIDEESLYLSDQG